MPRFKWNLFVSATFIHLNGLATREHVGMTDLALMTIAKRGVDTDRETILRAIGGDADAFIELYRKHYGQVAGLVYRRVGYRDETEDLVSEVFFRILRGLPRYTWRRLPFEAWVCRVTTNTVNEWYRKEKRRRLWSQHANGNGIPCDKCPSLSMEEDETQRIVRRAVARLSVKHQAVVSLFYFEDMSLEDVASALGCRVGTVKSRLSRARAALRTQLNDEGWPES